MGRRGATTAAAAATPARTGTRCTELLMLLLLLPLLAIGRQVPVERMPSRRRRRRRLIHVRVRVASVAGQRRWLIVVVVVIVIDVLQRRFVDGRMMIAVVRYGRRQRDGNAVRRQQHGHRLCAAGWRRVRVCGGGRCGGVGVGGPRAGELLLEGVHLLLGERCSLKQLTINIVMRIDAPTEK